MENYVKGEERVIELELPFPSHLTDNLTNMRIKSGSKVRNIVAFVIKLFKDEAIRRVVFSGFDSACAHVISCVEVFKRQYKELLYQWNAVVYRRTEEFWEPQIEGLDRLKVNRDTPAIFILISKDAIEGQLSHLSYQLSTDTTIDFPSSSDSSTKRKLPPSSGGVRKSENKWRKPKTKS